MIKPSKVKAAGALEDIKIVLGWVYNTRTLCLSLPELEFIACTKTIQDILSKDETNANNLESLIGRLNNTALIITLARHFLARLRYFYFKMNAFAQYRLRPNICDYLKLHMRIFHKAHKFISVNLLTYREPTRIYITNTCKICMVGFRSERRAWRWQSPNNTGAAQIST